MHRNTLKTIDIQQLIYLFHRSCCPCIYVCTIRLPFECIHLQYILALYRLHISVGCRIKYSTQVTVYKFIAHKYNFRDIGQVVVSAIFKSLELTAPILLSNNTHIIHNFIYPISIVAYNSC